MSSILWNLFTGCYYWATCSYESCLNAAETGLQVAQESGLHFWDDELYALGAEITLTRGELEVATQYIEKMAPFATIERWVAYGHYQGMLSWYELCKGNAQKATAHSQAATNIALESGSPFVEALNRNGLGQALFDCGDRDKAMEQMTWVRDFGESINSDWFRSTWYFFEARFALAEGDKAQQNLKITLHRLRRLIGNDAIRLHEGSLTLDRRRCWVDIWALENLLDKLEKESRNTEAPLTLFDRAIELYRGPFLPGEDNAPWAITPRKRIQSRFLRLLMEQARRLQQNNAWQHAIEIYEKGLEADHLSERLYQRLMECYLAMGHRAEALAIYRRCRDLFQAVMGMEPSPETQALYQRIREGTAETPLFLIEVTIIKTLL